MNQSPKSSFLDNEVCLLAQHFGVEKVQAALGRVLANRVEKAQKPCRKAVRRHQQPARPNIAVALESIRVTDPEKHRLLSLFLDDLRHRRVLRESQDIRYFAQLIGLKEIAGRSRRDMLPALIRFLLEQPEERLKSHLEKANNISEQQRQMGFSVLTDKLVGKR